MYTFTADGVRILCGACHQLTPVHTATPIKVGTPPTFCRIETGRWDFDRNAPETRLAKYPRTRKVDGCPACVDRLARQRRAGGYDFLPDRPAPVPAAVMHTPATRMPRLIKHRKEGAP